MRANGRAVRSIQRRRWGYTRVNLLVSVTVVVILVSLVIVGLGRAREASRKTQCTNQLKNLVFGMHSYEFANGRLPGMNAASPARISMLADILPYNSRTWPARLNAAAAGPSILSLPDEPVVYSAQTWPLNPALPECGPVGAHRQLMAEVLPLFNCPSDPSRAGCGTALSYVPVVSASHPEWTDRGARTADRTLDAIWPASSEGAVTGQIENPLAPPPYASRMNPPTVEGITDGSSNTIGLAERVKGAHVTGIRDALNSACYGMAKTGFVVDEDGRISQDNSAQVSTCRQNAAAGNQRVPGPNHNDLSGAQWFQYTCVWMGCANTMGPPNSPVCSAGGDRAIAESGIAPPSSRHGPGAHCGFMDGSVRFVNEEIDLRVFHALGTIKGGEKYEIE